MGLFSQPDQKTTRTDVPSAASDARSRFLLQLLLMRLGSGAGPGEFKFDPKQVDALKGSILDTFANPKSFETKSVQKTEGGGSSMFQELVQGGLALALLNSAIKGGDANAPGLGGYAKQGIDWIMGGNQPGAQPAAPTASVADLLQGYALGPSAPVAPALQSLPEGYGVLQGSQGTGNPTLDFLSMLGYA